MSDPFDLADTTAYLAWRAAKLSSWPCDTEPLRVEVEHLADPQSAELEAIQSRVAKWNLALIACSESHGDRPDAAARVRASPWSLPTRQ